MTKKGKLFVISGPSGAGKSTIVNSLVKLVPDLVVSVSATTRSPRPGEIDGQDYYFLDKKEFERRKEEGEFLEWAEVHGNLYGTFLSQVDKAQAAGKEVLLEIDVQGALQVKNKRPDAVLIFVEPPHFQELVDRLEKRLTEDEESLGLRLENARYEMALKDHYSYRVINKELSKAVEDIAKIITNERGIAKEC